MADDVQITFFVPCLNEGKNVTGALEAILGALSDVPVTYEIMVVDDASTDDTVAVVRAFHAAHPEANITLITNAENQGLGHNYRAGAGVAKGRYYMLVNGDNVERRDVIAALLSRIGQADIVIPFFGSMDTRPMFRILVSRTFTKLVNFLSGTKVRYYNGAVLHLRENVLAHHPGTRGFGYQAELITKLISLGATYSEVEVHSEERQFGTSGAFKFKNFVSVSGSLWRIAKRGSGKKRRLWGCLPNLLLVIVSIGITLAGAQLAGRAAGAWLQSQSWPAATSLRDSETTLQKKTEFRVVLPAVETALKKQHAD